MIGELTIVKVPGQHGGNVTLFCAAISNREVLHHRHHATLGLKYTKHLLTLLGGL